MKWNIPAEWRVRGLVQIEAPTLADAIAKLHATSVGIHIPADHDAVFQPRYYCNEEIEEIREMYNADEPDRIGDTATMRDIDGRFIASNVQWELAQHADSNTVAVTGTGCGTCYILSNKLGANVPDTLCIGSDASDIRDLSIHSNIAQGVKHLVINKGYTDVDMHFGLNNLTHHIIDAVIADGARTIGCEAFYSCNTLRNIKLPDTVTTIRSRAFAYSGLQTIKVGAGLHTIETQAFDSEQLQHLDLSAADHLTWHVCDNNLYGHSQLLHPISIDLPRHLTIIGKRKHIADFIRIPSMISENITFTAWQDSIVTIAYTDDPNAIQSVSIRMQKGTNKNPVLRQVFGNIDKINMVT